MSTEIFMRYTLEYALMIPIVIFAVVPVKEYLRFNSLSSFIAAVILLTVAIIAGSFISVKFKLRPREIFVPFSLIFFVIYVLVIKTEFDKKLFCFMNSIMICVLCPMYAIILMAPYELVNAHWLTAKLFTFRSGLVCIILSIPFGFVFFKTLNEKIPYLMREEHLESVWKYSFLIPLSVLLFAYWITPISPFVVITGRVRSISLILYLLVPGIAFFVYHVFWWTTVKLMGASKLQQENNMLQMEIKRYNELRKYFEKTRELRHDFRQHILVISQLSKAFRIEELNEYLRPLNEKISSVYKRYCSNSAVDAVASYYDSIASAQGTKINFQLNLPVNLLINEADYCAMLGNLVENALRAVKDLESDEREIQVISSMLSDSMLGLSVDNRFKGKINFNKTGLPVSEKSEHGIGLISVSNTVKRYGGTMNINSENQIFSVDIILYFNQEAFS